MRHVIILLALSAMFTVTGCSVMGKSTVEIAPYTVLQSNDPYELRHYERMVLVSTVMESSNGRNTPFGRLFDYISGNNDSQTKIPMTAPVFMDRAQAADQTMMSFVMPADFNVEDTPIPLDQAVSIEEVSDYTVATITFNGRLQEGNITKHQALLESWIDAQGLTVIGEAKTAGYNAPFTLPAMRRNEVLIPVEAP